MVFNGGGEGNLVRLMKNLLQKNETRERWGESIKPASGTGNGRRGNTATNRTSDVGLPVTDRMRGKFHDVVP